MSEIARVFDYRLDGLVFQITVTGTEGQEGSFSAEISVLEGSANFNALLWGGEGSDEFVFSFTGRDSSLNLNDVTYEGQAIDWDGGAVISNLGRVDVSQDSYLLDGETVTLDLNGVTSFADLEYLGVRASATSAGSTIRLIDEGETLPPPPPPVADDVPDYGLHPDGNGSTLLATVALVWGDSPYDGNDGANIQGNGDGYTVVTFGGAHHGPSGDPDDLIAAMIAYVQWARDAAPVEGPWDQPLLGVIVEPFGYSWPPSATFYAVGEANTNGTAADPMPAGLEWNPGGTLQDDYHDVRSIPEELFLL